LGADAGLCSGFSGGAIIVSGFSLLEHWNSIVSQFRVQHTVEESCAYKLSSNYFLLTICISRSVYENLQELFEVLFVYLVVMDNWAAPPGINQRDGKTIILEI
jgi:hypothetical protein